MAEHVESPFTETELLKQWLYRVRLAVESGPLTEDVVTLRRDYSDVRQRLHSIVAARVEQLATIERKGGA